MSAITTGMYGMINASARFERAATQTVKDSSQGNDVVSDFVEQIEARSAFEASISVIKASNDMTGRLLNMKV